MKIYKVTGYAEPDGKPPFEKTLFCGRDDKQARKAFHKSDPIGDVKQIRWYVLDITDLDADSPGVFPATPAHVKSQIVPE
jgi:hypothetical protein